MDWAINIEELSLKVSEALSLPFDYLLDSSKRLHWFYLLWSILLPVVVYRKKLKFRRYFKYLFSAKVWLGQSAMVDYAFMFLNAFVKVFILAPFVLSGMYFAVWLSDQLEVFLGAGNFFRTGLIFNACFFIALVLVKDFFVFLIHWMMHKVPFLWSFHKVHHAATSLNPLTLLRIHPVELVLNNFTMYFAVGLVAGVFNYLAVDGVNVITLASVGGTLAFFHVLGSNLRHSHVPLKYPLWLNKVLMSPFQHQIHHSNNPLHFDKNMGSVFVFWDKLFNTFFQNASRKINFGIDPSEQEGYRSFSGNLLRPFADFFKSFLSKK